jgi:hypothetical protein
LTRYLFLNKVNFKLEITFLICRWCGSPFFYFIVFNYFYFENKNFNYTNAHFRFSICFSQFLRIETFYRNVFLIIISFYRKETNEVERKKEVTEPKPETEKKEEKIETEDKKEGEKETEIKEEEGEANKRNRKTEEGEIKTKKAKLVDDSNRRRQPARRANKRKSE